MGKQLPFAERVRLEQQRNLIAAAAVVSALVAVLVPPLYAMLTTGQTGLNFIVALIYLFSFLVTAALLLAGLVTAVIPIDMPTVTKMLKKQEKADEADSRRKKGWIGIRFAMMASDFRDLVRWVARMVRWRRR
jgi:hypothetical protein